MERPIRTSLARFWPWLVLAMATIPSVWYVLDYEDDIDPELPAVVRPTFNRYPPAAYRFAEAGDTIDHVAVYVASAALVLAAWGWFRNARSRGWAAATVVSAAGFWHAATPGPLADGWYGLGWRIIFDPRAPVANRLIMAGLAVGVVAVLIWALIERPLRSVWLAAKDRGVLGLSIAAALLIAVRQVAWLDVEPIGFWPRWLYVWGLFAWSFVLVRLAPPAPLGWSRNAIVAAMVMVSLGLDFAGRGLFWYQRPIHRLREVDPGRIYFSAMPTYQGLKLAQERYHFRTIINLFPESTPEQSPHWPDELRFARTRPEVCRQPVARRHGRRRDSSPRLSSSAGIRRRGRFWSIVTPAWIARRHGWRCIASWCRDGRSPMRSRSSSATGACGRGRRSRFCTIRFCRG